MKWFFPALILLIAALVFDLGLMAYAMYALLGAILASRLITQTWTENLAPTTPSGFSARKRPDGASPEWP